jgi:hypothetical protein
MAQVTRRNALSLIAGTAVAGTTIAQPALTAVAASPAPIFAAIESHRAATARLCAALATNEGLDRELPLEKCRSHVAVWGEEIVATDDPRWIESERAVMRGHNDEKDAAWALVDIQPTTPAGMLALLQYGTEADTDGLTWPTKLLADDGKTERSWHFLLLESLAKALPDVLAAA